MHLVGFESGILVFTQFQDNKIVTQVATSKSQNKFLGKSINVHIVYFNISKNLRNVAGDDVRDTESAVLNSYRHLL
jgi:hypothetical protein